MRLQVDEDFIFDIEAQLIRLLRPDFKYYYFRLPADDRWINAAAPSKEDAMVGTHCILNDFLGTRADTKDIIGSYYWINRRNRLGCYASIRKEKCKPT
jgi:hypothetical protein